MGKHSNPARLELTPRPRAGQADGSAPDSCAPVGLSPETSDAIARIDRLAAQATAILILLALLWFATALPGAILP